ncbi:MAG: sugar nucleotide-binding protein, partial [Anaerolineales bacterium]|nr:sugar nucleotide-binding protein [Anaerolineales bacterium]
KAKAIAEQIVLANCASAAIVRTSLIYGICPLDHQTKWLVDDVRSGNKVVLFTDEVRCPIWVDTLAQSLLELANGSFHGFLNIAGPNSLNRWDFGIKLLDMLNVDLKSNIIPGLQSESSLLRPRNLTLEVGKAQHLLDTPLLNVDEAINHMKLGLSHKTIID